MKSCYVTAKVVVIASLFLRWIFLCKNKIQFVIEMVNNKTSSIARMLRSIKYGLNDSTEPSSCLFTTNLINGFCLWLLMTAI